MQYLHTLDFSTRTHLSCAYAELSRSERVEDCLVEADDLRIRFLAPAGVAQRLTERIYLRGGLRWCSRHRTALPEDGRG